MRQRRRHIVDTWREIADPLKHVFEAILSRVILFVSCSECNLGHRNRHLPYPLVKDIIFIH